MVEQVWTWVLVNKEWVFSGIGVVVVGSLLNFIRRRDGAGLTQRVRAGASSQNFQAGRDVHVMLGDTEQRTRSPRQKVLEELVAFCSESKAATTKLFLTRPTNPNPDTRHAFLSAFAECEVHDAKGQQMQLRVREVFPEPEVQQEFFEFLRRTSLVRQSTAMMEDECRDQAFASDQSWVAAQVRRVISAAARAAGYDLERGVAPFLIGFYPSFVGDLETEDADGQPPSSRILYEHSLKRAKAQWEATGQTWDPSKHELNRERKQKPEPAATPRRDSDPDIREQQVVNFIPIEEKHLLWLAGYDSRPALVLV